MYHELWLNMHLPSLVQKWIQLGCLVGGFVGRNPFEIFFVLYICALRNTSNWNYRKVWGVVILPSFGDKFFVLNGWEVEGLGAIFKGGLMQVVNEDIWLENWSTSHLLYPFHNILNMWLDVASWLVLEFPHWYHLWNIL